MPHAVLTGKAAIEAIFKEPRPLFIRNGNAILKTMDIYLERGKNVILVDSLAVKASKKTVFPAMISGRDLVFKFRF